jgi:hypothetical protein
MVNEPIQSSSRGRRSRYSALEKKRIVKETYDSTESSQLDIINETMRSSNGDSLPNKIIQQRKILIAADYNFFSHGKFIIH